MRHGIAQVAVSVVFGVGGIIHVPRESRFVVVQDNVTIAGQNGSRRHRHLRESSHLLRREQHDHPLPWSLQGGAAGEAAALSDLHGAGRRGAGGAPPSRWGVGLALRRAPEPRVPRSSGGAGFHGEPDAGVAGGRVPDEEAAPGARWPSGSARGAAAPLAAWLVFVARPPPGGGRGRRLGRRAPGGRHRGADSRRAPPTPAGRRRRQRARVAPPLRAGSTDPDRPCRGVGPSDPVRTRGRGHG